MKEETRRKKPKYGILTIVYIDIAGHKGNGGEFSDAKVILRWSFKESRPGICLGTVN